VVAGKLLCITHDEAAPTVLLYPDGVSGKALSARSAYQAKSRDREQSKCTPFQESGLRETIRSNRARGPSRYMHKITLVHTHVGLKVHHPSFDDD